MDIDLLNPASFIGGHPHDQYDWLRENAPIYRHKDPGGADFWAVTRYEDGIHRPALRIFLIFTNHHDCGSRPRGSEHDG